MKQFNIGLALSGCLALHSALAGGPEIPQFMAPMTPGVSVAGNFIDFNSGWADALIPVFRTTPSSFLYLDPQGLYHNNDQYSASIGGGFRMLTQSAGILGAYVFGDYNHSQQNNEYWFVSPGLERLGDRLDFSVNGYFPVSARRNNAGTAFASDLGDMSSVQFSGHDEMDAIIQFFESTGTGVDGEVGYRLPFLRNNTKLYLGGYYFAPKDNDSITGGIAKLEIPVNNLLSLTVSDAYDNIFHNTFRAGASLSLWGRSTHFHNHSIETRMVDSIQRNRIAQEGHSGTDQYLAAGQEKVGMGVMLSNIWFFKSDIGPFSATAPTSGFTTVSFSECTQENPCPQTDVNSSFFTGINAISPNAILFLAPGTYESIHGALVLNPGQMMYGRDNSYVFAAQGGERALLVGSVDLPGSNIMDSLRLGNDENDIQSQGILIEDGAQQIALNNMLIGNTGSAPTETYSTGVMIGNNSTINISNSEVDGSDSTSTGVAIALESTGAGNQIRVTNSTLTATQTGGGISAETIVDNGGNNSWQLMNNQIAAATVNGNSTFVSNIDFSGSGFDTWTVQNNNLTLDTFGDVGGPGAVNVLDSSTQGFNVWILTGNQLPQTVQSLEIEGIFDGSAGNNVWKLTNNTFIGDEGVTVIYDSSGGHNNWTLTGNNVAIVTGSLVFINDVNSGGGDTWTVTNNQISANSASSTEGSFILEVSVGGNNWKISNNTFISVAEVAPLDTTIILDRSGGGNSWTLTGNTLSLSTSTNAGVPVEGIEANVSGTWMLTQNSISLTASGTNFPVIGLQSDGGVWAMSNNQITVSNGDTAPIVEGLTIGGSNGTVTSNRDTFMIHSQQAGTGIAAGAPGSNSISVTNDTIGVIAVGATYGIFDSTGAGVPNHNTWNPGNSNPATLAAANTITVSHTGTGQICRVRLGNTCIP